MAEEEQKNVKTYRGNCHCGAYVFEFDAPEIKSYTECNCSICFKKGYAWLFPGDDNIKVVKGDDSTFKTYRFNKGKYEHRFCPKCGTGLMAFTPSYPPGMRTAVNVRAVQDVDLWALERKEYDGHATPPLYRAPAYTGPEPQADVEGGKVYYGSCHCGDVTVAAKLKPLEKSSNHHIIDCNCSICRRGGYIWIYPLKPQVEIQGMENLTFYSFYMGIYNKAFCKRCGVHICNERADRSAEEVAALPDLERKWYGEANGARRPITLRMLNDLDKSVLKELEIEQLDGWDKIEPMYQNP